MSDTVISVENLGKMYRIGHQVQKGEGLRHAIHELATAPFRWLKQNVESGKRKSEARDLNPTSDFRFLTSGTEDFWALQAVSFEIKRGEVVGVIGRNGAGKSTLLKILSRITEPTQGRVKIKGRVASLLEVGTGFHPELTGRENIFLNGAILGMSRAEIKRKFDEIVGFAEVEKFLDTPVKRYSSGMYVRLAFAVAAHMEPDILVVDEVLAVGDCEFQNKCLGKMREVSTGGRTVLFVSHNMQALSQLTVRSIYLEKGKVMDDGPTGKLVSRYLGSDRKGLPYRKEFKGDKPLITRIAVVTSDAGFIHRNGKPLKIEIEVTTPYEIQEAWVSFQLVNQEGQPIVHAWISSKEIEFCKASGKYLLICTLPNARLYLGNYSVKVYFSEHQGGERFDKVEGVSSFDVTMFGTHRDFEWSPKTCSYIEEFYWEKII
jgi:ABC-type polysaccharide/polyol phosphate transport system ATPase subunit